MFLPRLKFSPTRPPSHLFFEKPCHMAAFYHNRRYFPFVVAIWCSGAGWYSATPPALAQEPVIQRIEASGLQPGQTASLTAHGSQLKGVTRIWSPFGLFSLKDGQDPNADTGLIFTGQVPADTSPGSYVVRAVGPGGSSEGYFVAVDSQPSAAATPESEVRASPQVIAAGTTVFGVINPVKPRYFQVNLTAGQAVSIEVLARRLSSDLDPLVTVTGPDGKEAAYADDVAGLEGDCHVTVKAAQDGAYLIELRDVRYTGSPRHHFQLRVGQFELPSPAAGPGRLGTSPPAAGQAGQSGLLPASDVVMAAEPNDTREAATAVAATTTAVRGGFETPGDSDWLRIQADAATPLAVFAHTRDIGSAADVVLRLWGATGGPIAEADDSGVLDAQLISNLPAAGDYWLEVRELSARGGSEWTYQLELVRAAGAVEVTAPADRIQVPRGGSAAMPLTVRRINYDGPLQIEVQGLPSGMSSAAVTIGAKQSTVPLVITASESPADPTVLEAGLLQLQILSPGRSEPMPAVLRLVPPAPRKKDGELFRSFQLRSDVFAAVRPAAEFSVKPDPAKVTVQPGMTAAVKLTAVRHADFQVPVDIALSVPADQLPPGIQVPAVKLEAAEVTLNITAAADAQPGSFTVYLQGTAKKDNKDFVQPVPPIVVEIVKP